MGKNDEDKQYLELIKFSPSNQSSYTNIYQKIGKELKSAFTQLLKDIKGK